MSKGCNYYLLTSRKIIFLLPLNTATITTIIPESKRFNSRDSAQELKNVPSLLEQQISRIKSFCFS